MSQDVTHYSGGHPLVDLTRRMAMAQDMTSKVRGGDASRQRMLAKYVTNGRR
jgi:hypothetical protein